jgi:4-fold beta flower protein
MPMTFYDRAGKAFAYAEDDVHIFLYTGHPAGYIVDGSVYAFSGRHLGTLRAGWLRDHAGKAVLCTGEAVAADGLEPPLKLDKPPKLLKKPKPAKGHRETAPHRSDDEPGWSETPPEALFGS